MARLDVQVDVSLVGEADKRPVILLRLLQEGAQRLDEIGAALRRCLSEQFVCLFEGKAERVQHLRRVWRQT